MNEKIIIAKGDEEIQRCYPVMAELRPHIGPDEFLRRVKTQVKSAGYRLAYVTDGEVKAVAGFRITETLAWGKLLWLDDLVARGTDRSKGYGGALFDWLVTFAKQQGCEQLHLDSRVHRYDAHRFYLSKRMVIECHHFSMNLKTPAT